MGAPTIPNIRNTPLAENQQITVAWSAPSSGQPLSYRLTLNPGNQVVTGIPGSYSEFTFGSLTNGTQYSISIDATNDGSIYGPAANFLPSSPGGPPSTAPINARAAPSGSNGITVSWNAPNPLPTPPPNFYIISSANAYQGDSPVKIVQQTSAGNSINIPNIDPTRAYQYSVQAVNDVGYGPLTTTNNISFNQNGGVFDWGTTLLANPETGGPNFIVNPNSVTSDSENNIYVGLSYTMSSLVINNYYSTLGNGTISTTRVATLVSTSGLYFTPTNNLNSALLKYSSTGQLQWIAPAIRGNPLTIAYSVTPLAIKTDSQNNVYATYSYNNSIDFYNATNSFDPQFTSTGTFFARTPIPAAQSIAIVKYTSSGIIQSITPIRTGLPTAGFTLGGNSLQIDSQDNVYVTFGSSSNPTFYKYTGISGSSFTISTSALMPQSIRGTVNFLAKYNSNMDIQWATYTSYGFSPLALDSNANIYITTNISSPSTTIFQYGGVSSARFLVSTYGTMLVSTSASYQSALNKYDTNGQAQWATQIFASTATTTGITINSLTTDINNNSIISGNHFSNVPQFHSFLQRTSDGFISTGVSGIFSPNTTSRGTFLTMYNTNGQFMKASGMTTNVTNINALTTLHVTDTLGNSYVRTNFSAAPLSATLSYSDYYSTVNSTIQTIQNMAWTRPFNNSTIATQTYTLQKYDSNLQMQYVLSFSNGPPYVSTMPIVANSICTDRTNALYIVGWTSTISSFAGLEPDLRTPAAPSYIPVPQWQGLRGPPYSGATLFIQTSSLALSSPMVSTGTYGYILRYK